MVLNNCSEYGVFVDGTKVETLSPPQLSQGLAESSASGSFSSYQFSPIWLAAPVEIKGITGTLFTGHIIQIDGVFNTGSLCSYNYSLSGRWEQMRTTILRGPFSGKCFDIAFYLEQAFQYQHGITIPPDWYDYETTLDLGENGGYLTDWINHFATSLGGYWFCRIETGEIVIRDSWTKKDPDHILTFPSQCLDGISNIRFQYKPPAASKVTIIGLNAVYGGKRSYQESTSYDLPVKAVVRQFPILDLTTRVLHVKALKHAPQPKYTLAITPDSNSIVASGCAHYQVTVTPQEGFVGDITLSASGLPEGLTAIFSPTTISITHGQIWNVSLQICTDSGVMMNCEELPMFNFPLGICIDDDNNIYINDAFNSRIRKISADGQLSTFAGNGQSPNSSALLSEGIATSVSLYAYSLWHHDGYVYFTHRYYDSESKPLGAIYRINIETGDLSLFANSTGSADTYFGIGVYHQDSTSFFIPQISYPGRGDDSRSAILRVSWTGTVEDSGMRFRVIDGFTPLYPEYYSISKGESRWYLSRSQYAGDWLDRFSSDLEWLGVEYNSVWGGAVEARFGDYAFIGLKSNQEAGAIYAFKEIEDGLESTTIIGSAGGVGYSGDDGPAINAKISPSWAADSPGIVFKNGIIYFCDSNNHCIRKVDTATGIISLVAGTPQQAGFGGDGGPAKK